MALFKDCESFLPQELALLASIPILETTNQYSTAYLSTAKSHCPYVLNAASSSYLVWVPGFDISQTDLSSSYLSWAMFMGFLDLFLRQSLDLSYLLLSGFYLQPNNRPC